MHPCTVCFRQVLRGVGRRQLALIGSLALAGAALADETTRASSAPALSSGETGMWDFPLSFRVKEGRQLFLLFCTTCHGVYAEGRIGPNLTDDSWIHGGKPSEITASVVNGYAEKGMPSWIRPLGTDRVKSIVTYLLWLPNMPLPPDVKGKPAEGAPMERQVSRPATVGSFSILPTPRLVFSTTSPPPAPKKAADPSGR